MSRGQKLEPVHPAIELGPRQKSTGPFCTGEWRQEAWVGNSLYQVTMRRGQRVRIPYKPRGQNIGFKWIADVYRFTERGGASKHVWGGEVNKSAGVRGILLAAGVVWTESGWWSAWFDLWFTIGRRLHVFAHPQCRDPEEPGYGRRASVYDRIHVCQNTCELMHVRYAPCPRCGGRER